MNIKRRVKHEEYNDQSSIREYQTEGLKTIFCCLLGYWNDLITQSQCYTLWCCLKSVPSSDDYSAWLVKMRKFNLPIETKSKRKLTICKLDQGLRHRRTKRKGHWFTLFVFLLKSSAGKGCASLFLFSFAAAGFVCLMRRRRQCGSARRAAPRCLPAISVAWFSHLGPFSALTGRAKKNLGPKVGNRLFFFWIDFNKKKSVEASFHWNTGAQLSVSVNETNRMRFLLF